MLLLILCCAVLHVVLCISSLVVPLANVSTIAMEEQTVIARDTIGGAVVRITMVPPVSAIRAIAKILTGRNFAPKALGLTLALR